MCLIFSYPNVNIMKNLNTSIHTYTCKECAYYTAYYVKINGCRMRNTFHGYCKLATIKSHNRPETQHACQKFNQKIENNDSQSKTLQKVLNDICKKLNDIALALTVD